MRSRSGRDAMQRAMFQLRLFSGAETAFDQRCASPAAQLADALHTAGLDNASAFRRGADVWFYGEAKGEMSRPDGAGRVLDRLVASVAWRSWLAGLADVVMEAREPGGMTRYHEVFHSNGPALAAPFERGLFVLVVHPERIAEYDARHAEPWPEMIAALEQSGFRNYSGFRSGSQVAYYGQFHPDLATSLAAIGATETNRRWGESFGGIITSLADDQGRLFTAREVFHLD